MTAATAYAFVNIFVVTVPLNYGSPVVSPVTVATPTFTTLVVVDPVDFGDQVCWVSEGRDHDGPFASIGVAIGPGNPSYATLAASGYTGTGWGLLTPTVTPLANLLPITTAGSLPIEFVYRPTNDPANPGYPSPMPAAAGAVNLDAASAHHAAEAFQTFRAAAYAAAASGYVPAMPAAYILAASPAPWLEMELDLAVGSPTQGEFYKYRVVH
jgi:hypothetical protein